MTSITIRSDAPQLRFLPAHTLLDRVGRTPLIRLARVVSGISPSVEVYAKAEWFNPSGSVKDRPAASILRHAVERGELNSGRILLDATSGNMGIAYACLGAALGIRSRLAIPANANRQRLTMLRALGAELELTDPLEGTDGARAVASELASRDPGLYYFADQYANPANWQAHFESTGPEIVEQTNSRLTHFIAGLGTTGTMVGTGRYLRQALPDARLVAVQPDGPMHGLEGLKHLPTSHVPPIHDRALPDETVGVSTEEAYAMALRLAREEGLLVSVSAAAAAVAALRLAERLQSGVLVVLFPDAASKYLDEPFWRGG